MIKIDVRLTHDQLMLTLEALNDARVAVDETTAAKLRALMDLYCRAEGRALRTQGS